ncbi:echinoderm microtubule-associated protein-like 2 isoform X3 [Bacillus rossius redtenbacheri]|uniref:echinoderm microtubule-associated protein-like 2 isoform X3 n=1 Tax=Bacillus rossius redtenbacheri TaxID=93214 RepID=UPI002FDD204B
MRLNGRPGSSSVGSGSEQGSSATAAELDDMIETENESLRERVSDLEKKVLEQGDEIVCLRSTLADVLRRLNQFESRPIPAENRIPVRNGSATPRGVLQNNHIPSPANRDSPGSRLRYQGSISDVSKDSIRRAASYASSLPQRYVIRQQRDTNPPTPNRSRVVHYQSTCSLHSDSHSSNSVSPVPTSPSPTHTPPAPPAPPRPAPAGGRSTPAPAMQRPASVGNLSLSKRWSSTGDFNNAVMASPQSAMAIASRVISGISNATQFSSYYWTRDASYNEEEGAVRMYLRGRPVVLYAPSDVAESYDLGKVTTPPQSRLKLEWVYGYRGRDCRSNLYLLPTGEIVYFVAAAVVLYNVEEQSQRHYLGHTDDVKSLAIHPNKLLVATGQTAGHDRREGRSWKFNPPPDRTAPEADQWPHIRVWNSVSLSTVSVIGIGEFERSICCLSFSRADGGLLLCAVDEAPDHNISVWDWQRGERGQKITETKCSADTVVAAEFHPLERNCIVTCGKSHINFWSLDAGGTLYKRMGVFENRDKPKYVTCLAFTETGDVISGDSNGNVIVWGRGTNTISKFLRGVHEGSVFSICVMKEGSIVTGGGKDGRLRQFDSNFNDTGLEAQVAEHFGCVRVVSEGRGSQLLVGTTRNCVLTGGLGLGLSPAVLGHTDELWGLAVHPSLPQFLTAGHDRLLHLWDSMSHSIVWSKDIAEQAQSAAFSVDGSVIVVGCTTGHWLVMDSETREVYSMHTDGAEPIQVVRFSPDGALLALGSRDNNIYVYQVSEEARKYSRVGRCSGHSSFITHLDWSVDGQFIQSNSGDYELLYWNASLCRQIPQSSDMRDVEWDTNTCTLTFATIGIWPEGADGTDVNQCDRSRDGKLLATADDFGKVKLYSYPASQPKSLCHTYGGHSSHVTNVAFLNDDSRLISTGGRDTSIMQWMVS